MVAHPENPWNLSPRECEVMRLICAGKSLKQAGREMGIDQRTVQCHLTRARKKMGEKTRVGAVLAWDRNLRPMRPVPTVPARPPGKRELSRARWREAAQQDMVSHKDRGNAILIEKLREAMPWWKPQEDVRKAA